MKKVTIAGASAGQLAAFAATNLGLEVDARMGANRIRAAMEAAGYDKDFIEVDEPAPATRPAVATQPASAGTERRYVTVIIATQEYRGGDEPVPVSVNGRAMWIERAKPQRIPYEYYEALIHAVKKVYDPDPKGGLMPARLVPTYPVTLLPETVAA